MQISDYPSQEWFSQSNESGEPIRTGETLVTHKLSGSAGYLDGETCTIKCLKDEYLKGTSASDSHLPEHYWQNLMVGGLIGLLIVVSASGAIWELPESSFAFPKNLE